MIIICKKCLVQACAYQPPEVMMMFLKKAIENVTDDNCKYCGGKSSEALADMFDIIDGY